MKGYQYCFIMGAAFLAPVLPGWMAVAAGLFFTFMGVLHAAANR